MRIPADRFGEWSLGGTSVFLRSAIGFELREKSGSEVEVCAILVLLLDFFIFPVRSCPEGI